MLKKTLLDQMIKFTKKDKVRMHMPGHNGGAGLSSKFKKYAFSVDVTEFDETDNLQDPQSILLNSEKWLADVFGARRSYMLTNGSTLGLIAAILGAAKPGDKLIVDRNCHKAVVSAMVLGGIVPVFVEPEFNNDFGIYAQITPLAIMDAARENPDAVGAVITSPTYYGVCSDIEKLAYQLHMVKKFLIVDEAHGAHFAFSSELPKTALEQGADVAVQSAHKTLPALGQTALLHIGDTEYIDHVGIERSLRLLQTTSPSYMLLTSIDDAVESMLSGMGKRLDMNIAQVIELKTRIGVKDKISCLNGGYLKLPQDTLRLVVNFEKLGITGYGAAELLKSEHGIYPEMADPKNVVFYITASTTSKEISILSSALDAISDAEYEREYAEKSRRLPKIEMGYTMKEAYNSKYAYLDISHAEGRICADIISHCPPGAVIAAPGQIITKEVISYIKDFTDITSIKVVDNR